jgi:hypothetical protein
MPLIGFAKFIIAPDRAAQPMDRLIVSDPD